MSMEKDLPFTWRFPGMIDFVVQGKAHINISISTDIIKMMSKHPAQQGEIIERSLRSFLLLYPNYDEGHKEAFDKIRKENIKKRAPLVLQRKNIKPALPLDLIRWLNDHSINKSLVIEAALWEVLKPD